MPTINSISFDLDEFDGIVINPLSLPDEPMQLDTYLKDCLTQFACQNKRIIWVTLKISQSHLISVFTNNQFHFHNCCDDLLTLTRSLIENNEIPFKPTHTIGAGALVKNGQNILVIKEALINSTGYKLPGGHVELGENITDAAIREVHEETGIKAQFKSINGVLSKFPYRFDKANIYFVCCMDAITLEINIQRPEEIEDAKWVNVDSFLTDSINSEFNKAAVRAGFYGEGMPLFNIQNTATQNDRREIFFSNNIITNDKGAL